MVINVENKKVNITDKNVRAFNAMHYDDPTEIDIKAYVSATYRKEHNGAKEMVDQIIRHLSDAELSDIINDCIKEESCGICGNDFYKNI